MDNNWMVRQAKEKNIHRIREIYNQGIADRIATLEERPKTREEIERWFRQRPSRYAVLVAERDGSVQGWASLNPYSHRCAYSGVADVSIYVDRSWRGKGVGTLLLGALEEKARENGFYKMVLFTFPFNQRGQRLYRKRGFREVGIFRNHGKLDGRFVDVMAMEKLL